MRRALAVLLVAAAAVAGCAGLGSAPLRSVSDGRYLMGTVLEVELLVRDPVFGRAHLEAIFARVAALEGLLSNYDENSALSRLVRAADGTPQRVDARLAEVLAIAHHFGDASEGAFDITIPPLVRLWSRAARAGDLPPYEAVARSLRRVGVRERLRVEKATSRVALEAGTELDLSGVAKGYALDAVLPLLSDERVEAALASFGSSSVRAVGAPPDQEAWPLVLRSPNGGLAGVVELRDQAASVSSSLSQSLRIENTDYGHVIDPRTGWPLTERRQATVLAATAAEAEALSTALLVLGHEQGIALIERQPGAEAQLIDAQGRMARSSGWNVAAAFAPYRRPAAGAEPDSPAF